MFYFPHDIIFHTAACIIASFLLFFFEAGTFGIFVQNLPLWSLSPSFAYSGDDEDSEDPGITSLFFLLEPPEFSTEPSSEKFASITAFQHARRRMDV